MWCTRLTYFGFHKGSKEALYVKESPAEPAAVIRVTCIIPPPLPPPVSFCRHNNLGAEGATALSSGLTALTNLQSIDIW